jgi:hypothetical protein
MGVGFQVPIKNLVLILISTAVKTVVSEQFGKLTVTLVELLVSRFPLRSKDALVSHLTGILMKCLK